MNFVDVAVDAKRVHCFDIALLKMASRDACADRVPLLVEEGDGLQKCVGCLALLEQTCKTQI